MKQFAVGLKFYLCLPSVSLCIFSLMGAGLGASHQTGWTGVIARVMHLFATLTPEQALAGGKVAFEQIVAASANSSPLSTPVDSRK